MKNLIILLFSVLITTSCNFSKSVKLDLLTGLSTKGDGISCENVRVHVDNNNLMSNTISYGDVLYVDFSDVKGLKMENGSVFPGLELYVTNNTGDTLIGNRDLYSEYGDGVNSSPLLLTTNITAARPITSDGEYKLIISIWDKKGEGTFISSFNFSVEKNKKINTQTAGGVSCGEIYLYSKDRGKVINDNKVKVNEDTYLLFEGLTGFKESDGKVFPGLSMKASGADGEVLLDYDDMFSDYSQAGVDVAEFMKQVMTNFNFNTTDIKNPINVSVTIWDKKGEGKFSASTEVNLGQ